jgi:Mannosylglycerate hydrolase MGH1-like glycoside hydrolase domain
MDEYGKGINPGPLTREEWKKLVEESTRVFALNEVDQGDVYYHMPSCHHYPSLFAWDSGFHAAAMCHLNPHKAAQELETLFNQVGENGHLPHEVLLPNQYSTRWARGLQTRLVRWEFDGRGASFMVDPPSYHFAAEMVFRRTGDKAWLKRIWPRMRSCLDYLLEKRDVLGDGLVTIFHPWESGTDLSPQFFAAIGLKAYSRWSSLRSFIYPTVLYASHRLRGWDSRHLSRADHFVCEDLTVNCLAVRAYLSMSYLAGEIGRRDEASRFRHQAGSIMDALEEVCWDEEKGCYFPRVGYRRPRLARQLTAASLLPLFAGLGRRDRMERIVEEHMLNPGEFWTEYLIPFNPASALGGAASWVDKQLWSGNCIWINICWMLAIGLGENGYWREAREVTRRVVRMILREGFYEYYDSRTGDGKRIPDFCWPALSLDMAARFWPEIVHD